MGITGVSNRQGYLMAAGTACAIYTGMRSLLASSRAIAVLAASPALGYMAYSAAREIARRAQFSGKGRPGQRPSKVANVAPRVTITRCSPAVTVSSSMRNRPPGQDASQVGTKGQLKTPSRTVEHREPIKVANASPAPSQYLRCLPSRGGQEPQELKAPTEIDDSQGYSAKSPAIWTDLSLTEDMESEVDPAASSRQDPEANEVLVDGIPDNPDEEPSPLPGSERVRVPVPVAIDAAQQAGSEELKAPLLAIRRKLYRGFPEVTLSLSQDDALQVVSAGKPLCSIDLGSFRNPTDVARQIASQQLRSRVEDAIEGLPVPEGAKQLSYVPDSDQILVEYFPRVQEEPDSSSGKLYYAPYNGYVLIGYSTSVHSMELGEPASSFFSISTEELGRRLAKWLVVYKLPEQKTK